jgi:hypothetical protein
MPFTGTRPAENDTDWIAEDTAYDTALKAFVNALETSVNNKVNSSTYTSGLATKSDVVHTHTSAQITDFAEAAQDAINALLVGASGVTLAYDDVANTLTITGGGAGGGLDAEAVRDAIGVALIGTGLISVVVNDAADTITITTTATQNSTDAALRDRATHTGTQSADTLVDGTTNKAFLATERTKLAGVATGATANDTNANLRDRATHTGTQSADTIVDGTANKVFTATDEAKLGGIADAATANDTDANLLNRANHTGVQAQSTITNLVTDLAAKAGLASPVFTGNPTVPTPTLSDDDLSVANTEWVRDVIAAYLPSIPVAVQWNSTTDTWGTYDTSTARVRIFLSQDDIAATAPTYYNLKDLWFAHEDAP